MAFEKGVSGNPSGKPPGARNKTGLQLRETITNFLSENFPKVIEDFNSLKPRDRVKLYCDLLQYGLPKLQSVSLGFDLERLTDDQLDEVIEQLKQSAKDFTNHG